MSEKTGTIYGIRHVASSAVCYVGQTRNDPRVRWRQHACGDTPISRAMQMLGGVADFEFSIIEVVPVSRLNEREAFWIAELRTLHPNGMNRTEGGNAGPRSNATRKRMAEAKKTTCSDLAYRAALSERAKALWASEEGRAKKRAMWTEEAKAAVSEKSRALAADPAHIRKVSEGTRRAYANDAVRQRLSAAQKARWADPAARAAQSERLRQARARKKAERHVCSSGA